jgi:hypothetical protein
MALKQQRPTQPGVRYSLSTKEVHMTSSFHCLFCGQRIGVYERVVVLEHDGPHPETSLARNPELAERTRTFLIHATCAPVAPVEDVPMTS